MHGLLEWSVGNWIVLAIIVVALALLAFYAVVWILSLSD